MRHCGACRRELAPVQGTRRLQRVRLFPRSFVLYRPWIPGEHCRGICAVVCVTAYLRGFEEDSRSEVVFWIDEWSFDLRKRKALFSSSSHWHSSDLLSLEKCLSVCIAGKGNNSLQHYNLVHKFIPMPQAMKITATKAAVDKDWEILRKFWNGTWRKWETSKWSMKPGIMEEAFMLRHWRICVILRIRSWSLDIKNTKVQLYSEVTV